VSGVAQHVLAEIGGSAGGVDGAVVAVFDKGGQVAAVINVRVGEHDGVNAARDTADVFAPGAGVFAVALKEAAVAQHGAVRGLNEMGRAGDFLNAAEKSEVHGGGEMDVMDEMDEKDKMDKVD